MIWLVIALAMYRHQCIAQVAADLDLVMPDEINPDIAKSALTQARQRLGQEPLSLLFGMSATAWDQRHSQGRSWRGLARYAIDGSTLRTSDTPGNREHFGAQEYASGVVASYPQLRLLTLTSLASTKSTARYSRAYSSTTIKLLIWPLAVVLKTKSWAQH